MYNCDMYLYYSMLYPSAIQCYVLMLLKLFKYRAGDEEHILILRVCGDRNFPERIMLKLISCLQNVRMHLLRSIPSLFPISPGANSGYPAATSHP